MVNTKFKLATMQRVLTISAQFLCTQKHQKTIFASTEEILSQIVDLRNQPIDLTERKVFGRIFYGPTVENITLMTSSSIQSHGRAFLMEECKDTVKKRSL